MIEISERAFEDAIECALLSGGPDACAGTDDTLGSPRDQTYGDALPGGYRRRTHADYDRSLNLLPRDVLDFVYATQKKEWDKLRAHHGEATKDVFLKRVATELDRRGALDVLRDGIRDSGCKFQLAYFRPASGLNEESQRLYAANLFAIARQVRYSRRDGEDGKCLDLVLFLNGIPIFTAELKSPLNGQDVKDAIRQYMHDRDPREPLLAYGRCLAHFAVDPLLVYVTSQLAGRNTRFLPFNQGSYGGAGNPPVPPTRRDFATSYLWHGIWARDSVLDLIRQFIHEDEKEDERGKKTGERAMVFPRYHQIEAVRRLVAHARATGTGQRYLIQHSAGSGKSLTIGWLAHQLSTLHDRDNRRVFDSIVVITDRRILDRQLQSIMRKLEQTLGVVENIDTTSRQLKQALESGKTIIVTTLQKFPVIAKEIGELPGQRFAVIADEAHSSQSGEKSGKGLKTVLSAGSLEDAELEDSAGEDDVESVEDALNDAATDQAESQARKRGRLANVSFFAFTATPKERTLELFGTKREDGKFEPFHVYSMRQAIEESFILDVLASYTTYKAYWRLLKRIENDPRYDKRKAQALLKAFVDLHPHAIGQKVKIAVAHFAEHVQAEISGRAKAMIVTRSRLHAVRTKLALDRELAERGHAWKALVAFSGKVEDAETGKSYTEAGMNGFPERQTAKTFEQPEYRFLVVADKFQTGFDQPLLYAMYVDKKLGGVNAVQTLSRLNRIHPPDKRGTLVLDFTNEAEEIRVAFERYYETTLLSEGTDPNLLYELQQQLRAFPVYTEADVEAFARLFFGGKTQQAELYQALGPLVERFRELSQDEQRDFSGQLGDYVRLYGFLSQVLPFADADLEKLYVFAQNLRRLLPMEAVALPRDVQQAIDMESYRLQQTASGKIALERNAAVLEPQSTKGRHEPVEEQLEPLSQIISELNDRFGMNLGPEHRVTLSQMMDRLDTDAALGASARANTKDNVRLTFDQKVEDVIQDIVDSNFDLYKRITDDPAFGAAIKNHLFELYLEKHPRVEDLIKRGESKTLEFKSSLRWNLREDRQDDKVVTHAALKTIAAFLNTGGGDLLLGVADDGAVLGIEHDRLENDDKFMRHLAQVVRNGLGDRSGTCIDPQMQVVVGKPVCLVRCERSPEPVYLKWKGMEATPEGDFFVRQGPGTMKLPPESAAVFVRTRFTPREADEPAE